MGFPEVPVQEACMASEPGVPESNKKLSNVRTAGWDVYILLSLSR